MTKLSGEYRAKAAELRAEARDELNPQTKAGLEKLAVGYIHLAELAEKTPAKIVPAASTLEGDSELSP